MKRPSYDEMRRHIERRYSRIFWLIVHITLVVVTAEALWWSDPTHRNGNPWFMFPWFGLVLIHAVKVGMDILKERDMARTWKRYYGDLEVDEGIVEEKPKRLARLLDESEGEEALYQQNGHSGYPNQRQKGS